MLSAQAALTAGRPQPQEAFISFFGAVLSTLVTLLHIYVFVRAGSLPICKRWIGRKALIGSGAALWLIFSLSRIYGGHEYGLLTVVLEAVGMHWMATAVIFGHGTGELIDFWSNELGRFRRLIESLIPLENLVVLIR